jgi:tetratricopeptide (TPR) repeat protein
MRARPWLLQAAMSFGSTSRALSNSSMATPFDKALEIKPQYNHTLEGKGVAMARAGRYEESVQTFDKAIDIDPVFDPPWNGKGEALYRLGRFEDALQSLNRALDLEPHG